MATGGDSKKRKLDEDSNNSTKKKPNVFWNQGLLSSMNDPDLQVFADDKITVIKDKYPKAKYHFLVMPKKNIPNLKSLKKDDMEILKYMEQKGREIAKRSDAERQFRYGYHSVPSMRYGKGLTKNKKVDKNIAVEMWWYIKLIYSHLHLHVISQDFDSPSLKTKKHWNSFTTEYFVDSKEIIKKLEENGKVEHESGYFQSLLKSDLRCHVCRKELKTIPALKTHIQQHSYKIKSSDT